MAERSFASSTHPAYGLDWNLVRSFEAVARSGSLSAGARMLGIAHPTIARHVQHLEEQLGFSLFSRSKQGLVVNEAGERLMAAAAQMQAQALAFQNAADAVSDRAVPRVRVTVSDLLAEVLPLIALPAVEGLGDEPPAVEMIVTAESLNLLDREADIALRHARPTQQELIARRLGSLQIGLFASAEYLAVHGYLDRENVDRHRFVESATRSDMLRGARNAGLHIDPSRVMFRSDALACRRAAVVAGWGIGAFPSALAGSVDGLTSAMEDGSEVSLEVWLAARPEVRNNRQLYRVFEGIGQMLEVHLQNEVA